MMKDITQTEVYQKALAHTIQKAKFREDIQRKIDYITHQKGDVCFCTRRRQCHGRLGA